MNRTRTAIAVAAAIIVVAAVFIVARTCQTGEPPPKRAARPAAVAGMFYPGEAEELRRTVRKHLDAAKPEELGDVRALVAPHAGYPYSGPVAAFGFKAIEGRHYDTVIIMAPSHRYPLRGASIPNVEGYETPLGTVPLSPLADALRREEVFDDVPDAHAEEHSIEVELPFLQVVLGEFELVPILVGDADAEAMAAAILKHLDDTTLIIASSDLSHYAPYDVAKQFDGFTVQTIAEEDSELIELCQACGKTPIATLLRIARAKGWHPHVLDVRNSGDTAGDKSRVVGYCSVAFTKEAEPFQPPERSSKPLDEDEQKTLLELARASLEAAAKGQPAPAPDESKLTDNLRRRGGAFVTLTKHGELRGCIGHILPYDTLYESVIQNAAAAALQDPRFPRVREEELDEIHVEVSVLTVPRRLTASSPDELLKKLEPGKDGVYLVVGPYTSTYLPQVWDNLPDKADFMARLSVKAGLRADTWRSSAARVFIYHAQVFEEEQGEPTE